MSSCSLIASAHRALAADNKEQVHECASEHAAISRTRDTSARTRSASRPSGRAAPSGAPSTRAGRCRQRCLASLAALERPPPTVHGKGNAFCAFPFQGETAYNVWPFLDEKPKNRIRAFPKRINQMAATAKVELMGARSGEERKRGAGTGGDHSPDTLPHRPNPYKYFQGQCARVIKRLSAMLCLRP